jgi:hypothetical protein
VSFFDKKSEVISVELTQYGKHLLSKGKFKPVYYQFFDNDVIYDNEYGNLSEDRNNVQERIKNETPYSKPQYVFTGVETKLKQQIELKKKLKQSSKRKTNLSDSISLQQTAEKAYFGITPLGTSKLDDTFPSLNIRTHTTKISSSYTYKQDDTHVMQVPQITLDTTYYKTKIVYESEEPVPDELLAQSLPFIIEDGPKEKTFKLFEDETYISITPESIMLEFNEINSNDIGDNFEIELYEVTSSNVTKKEVFIPLYFINGKYEKNNENLIVDIGGTKEVFPAEDPSLVEYYLTFNLDSDIEKSKLESLNSMSTNSPKVFQDLKK